MLTINIDEIITALSRAHHKIIAPIVRYKWQLINEVFGLKFARARI